MRKKNSTSGESEESAAKTGKAEMVGTKGNKGCDVKHSPTCESINCYVSDNGAACNSVEDSQVRGNRKSLDGTAVEQ